MPTSANKRILDELLAAQEPENRYLDICLVLRRLENRETLLWAGGRWDLLDHRWSKQEPETGEIIDLHEGQVEFTRWYAGWLRDFREGFPREVSLALAGGARRGGKTFNLVACLLATLIDVPQIKGNSAIGWLVSVAHTEREELDAYIRRILNKGWYRYQGQPKYKYTFHHGAELTNISSDDPETLKRGRTDIIFYNEAQKMPRQVLTNGIGGLIDNGGLAILAANPPQRSKGEWVYDIRADIEAGEYGGVAKFFEFDPNKNPFIDAAAKRRGRKLLERLDPAAVLADDEGVWKKPGDLAYQEFSRSKHIRELPSLAGDSITRDITRDFTRRRLGTAYDFLGGYDPQGRPHHAGTLWKIFGTIDQPILYCVDEVVVDQSEAGYGEDLFLERASAKGYVPTNTAWIMDASSFWQDDRHRTTGAVSADYFKRWQYRHEPPQPPSLTSKTGRARNPDIDLRVDLLNRLLKFERVLIATVRNELGVLRPAAPWLAESLKDCPNRRRASGAGYVPFGKHAHITDTAGYVAWWVMPKPQATGKGGGGIGVMTIDMPQPRAW